MIRRRKISVMDLTARRDGFYMIEEKQEEAFTKTYPFFFPNLASSSFSPTATAPICWPVGQYETRAMAGGGGSDGSSKEENFFLEKEHMFDKVVTPSDVGKLNRLVIPKQYAEKYFPLNPATDDKGMLLSFEDRTGKSWRFRYSYWNSSQSYVMTKGWSRFVKDKLLDPGDVVSFGRVLSEPGGDHFYIDWKRRPNNHGQPRLPLARAMEPLISGNGGEWYFNIPRAAAYDHNRRRQVFGGYVGVPGGGGQFLYLRSSEARPPQLGLPYGGGGAAPMVLDSLPLERNKAAAAKRVRLFGVNLDCSETEGNARVPSSASAIAPLSPASSTIPFLPFAYGGIEASSSAASPLTSKQHHLTLDLDL